MRTLSTLSTIFLTLLISSGGYAGDKSTVTIPSSVCPSTATAFEKEPHVLVVMYLTTPVSKIDKKAEWTLQNVTSQEYDLCASCYLAAAAIVKGIAKTPTINLTGWCFRKFVPRPEDRERLMRPEGPELNLSKPLEFKGLVPDR